MSVAIYYLQILPDIREAAKRHGYAVGLHGSMTRDLDLIAVPWTEHASPPDVLAVAIKGAVNGNWDDERYHDHWHQMGKPGNKPHGRLCWSIKLGGGAYIDLSVAPPSKPEG